MWLGIKNYNPSFCEDTDQLLTNHKESLVRLHGEQILGIWILWNLTEDDWYSSTPIVVKTNSIQVEFCANKINEYSITYNSIDIECQVDPADMGDDEIWYFEWRQLGEARTHIGNSISKVEIIELLFETKVLHDEEHPERVGNEYSNWLLHGVCLNLDGCNLSFYNAFDTNGILYDREVRSDIQYRGVL